MNRGISCILFFLLIGKLSIAQHPSLTLTKEGVAKIKSGLGTAPLFDQQLKQIQTEVDLQIDKGISVPIPKDMAGAYTHEQHKYNYKLMHKAGNLYQFTNQEKYANYVKEMLFEYAEMYPTLPLHPTMKSYATGKIFWQCLNDANWLVFTSQAYDCIYDYLTEKERNTLEEDLFIPFANFLSIDNPRFFNRIHNHSTWANAAVGLMALAMDNDTLLEKALYGLSDDDIGANERDNDGGFIKQEGTLKAGFLAQLDYSFSPEGYFTEGPYYQRYAIFPFLVFSHALHNKRPDLKIFEYRDEILVKATKALLQLTDPQGQFFPINDSQKGMTYQSFELITAVDLMYLIKPEESSLLDWAAVQGAVAFNEAGFFVAKELANKKTNAPEKNSVFYGDGVDGNAGGIAALRMDDSELLFKFSSHGMGHGHYDRLSYSLYDEMGEIVQDYGAVRWVNVDQKGGGRYLPENKTFGKQTIAHNTASINQASQFEGKIKKAEKHNPDLYYVDFSDPDFQIVSAEENNAYANVNMHRVLILVNDEVFAKPLFVDLFALSSKEEIEVDLPMWYKGHFMKSSFECSKFSEGLKPIGLKDGYQHIWKEASGQPKDNKFQFNWYGNNTFYTLSSAGGQEDEVIIGRAGANDPSFNLRPDPVLIHRKKDVKNPVYFNIIESHGRYNTVSEIPTNPYSDIEEIEIVHADENYIICSFASSGYKWDLYYSLNDNESNSAHSVSFNSLDYNWKGVYKLIKSKT